MDHIRYLFFFNKIEEVRGSQYLKTVAVKEVPKTQKIEPQQALSLVQNKTYLKPSSVTEITEDKPGSEYRGRSLPLYIKLKHLTMPKKK